MSSTNEQNEASASGIPTNNQVINYTQQQQFMAQMQPHFQFLNLINNEMLAQRMYQLMTMQSMMPATITSNQSNQQGMMPVSGWRMNPHQMLGNMPYLMGNLANAAGPMAFPNQVPPLANNVHVQQPYAAMGMSASVGNVNAVADIAHMAERIPVQSNLKNPQLPSQSSEVIFQSNAFDEPHSTTSPSLTLQSASTATEMSPAKVSTDETKATLTQTASSIALLELDRDNTQESLKPKSPEMKVDPSVTYEEHCISKASLFDKQDHQASLSQLEQPPLQYMPFPQDNLAIARTQTLQQHLKEKKFASLNGKIEEGSKSVRSLLSCGIPKEKGTSFDCSIEDDKEIKDVQCKPQYTCDVKGCTKVFLTKEGRRRHVVCHRGEKNFICRYCDKTYALKFQYTRHKKTHEGPKQRSQKQQLEKKKFECDFCQKKYDRKGRLETHIFLHMGNNGNANQREHAKNHGKVVFPGVKAKQADLRPDLKCRLCQKLFQDHHDFNKHLGSHHGLMPYVCSWLDCGQTFTHKCFLDRHKKTHSAAKSIFPCPNCDNIYMHLDSLRRHLLRKH